MRKWRVPSTDTFNRRLKIKEAFLLDGSSNFSSKAICDGCFMCNKTPTGLLHRLKKRPSVTAPISCRNIYRANSVNIPWLNRHQVNHLAVHIQLLLGIFRDFPQHMNLRSPSNKCHITSSSKNIRSSYRTLKVTRWNILNG